METYKLTVKTVKVCIKTESTGQKLKSGDLMGRHGWEEENEKERNTEWKNLRTKTFRKDPSECGKMYCLFKR